MRTSASFLSIILVVVAVLAVALADGPGTETALAGSSFPGDTNCDEVVNSIDADGTREGYEINLTRLISEAVSIPVIASGGAGKPEHLHEVLTEGKADAALIASMVHFGEYTVSGIKQWLHEKGVKVRLRY